MNRRSWLFVPGSDAAAHAAAANSAADVLIQELEDFTPPELRPRARSLAKTLFDQWRKAGKIAAVRINPLDLYVQRRAGRYRGRQMGKKDGVPRQEPRDSRSCRGG